MIAVKLYHRKDEVKKDGYVPLMATFTIKGKLKQIRLQESFPASKITNGALVPEKNVLLSQVAKRVNSKIAFIELEIQNAITLKADVFEHVKARFAEYAKGHEPTEKPKPKADFMTLYKEWIEASRSRISNQTNQKLSPNTIKTYNIVKGHLEEFDKIHPLDITSMGKDFYTKFNKYIITTKSLSPNAFGKYMAILKVFMKWAEETLEERGVEISSKYQNFKAPKKYMGVRHLKSSELRRFQNFKTDRKVLEHANDLFLMMCYTGLSVSDLKNLTRANIRIDRIVISRGKTTNECIIPFFDDDIFKPVELFQKYDFKLPKMSDQNINFYLKEVQKAIEFDAFNITTKIGRKTFATIKHLEQKVPSQIVMRATGHTTEKAFLRYIGTDHDAVIESFQDNARNLKIG